MRNRFKFGLAAAALSFAYTTTASAVPVLFCKDGPGIDLVADGCISGTSNSYPGGGDGVYANPGDTLAAVTAAITSATGLAPSGLSLYGKSPTGLVDVVAETGGLEGTWDVLDPNVLIKYITVKAANSFSLYEIAGLGANSGSWTTAGLLNNGGQQPGMSHMSFWTVDGGVIPEPTTWAMMILGLGAVGAMMRRRQRQTVQYNFA